MILLKIVKIILPLFCYLTTIIMAFIGIRGALFNEEVMLDGGNILRVLFTAFLTALPVLIFYNSESISHKKLLIRKILHFVVTAGIAFGCQIYFGWIDTANAMYAVFTFFIIYVTAYTIFEMRDRKLAKKINERLNEFHKVQNETHKDAP